MVTNENQVRHLYVANTTAAASVNFNTAGDMKAVVGSGTASIKFFGTEVGRSDILYKGCVKSIKVTPTAKMAKTPKAVQVTVNSSVFPTAGEEYILKIAISQAFGNSVEDMYFKYGAVHVTSGMSASDFYKAMAKSLVQNFSREATTWFKFYLLSGTNTTTYTEVTPTTNWTSLTGTYTGIQIEEAEQPFRRGIIDNEDVSFEVYPGYINTTSGEQQWGTTTTGTSQRGTVYNSKATAALEYFLVGERGDIYRGMGFPNNFETTYLVNPSATYGYHFLDIQYFYQGEAEDSGKSPKTLTIVVPASAAAMAATGDASYTKIAELATAIGNAVGVTPEGLLSSSSTD